MRCSPGIASPRTGEADRLGARHGAGSREVPEQIPDRRIELFDQRFGLRGSHVLELGCFEGIHTIALCDRADRVTGIDARMRTSERPPRGPRAC